jgi:hypothetical protein
MSALLQRLRDALDALHANPPPVGTGDYLVHDYITGGWLPGAVVAGEELYQHVIDYLVSVNVLTEIAPEDLAAALAAQPARRNANDDGRGWPTP